MIFYTLALVCSVPVHLKEQCEVQASTENKTLQSEKFVDAGLKSNCRSFMGAINTCEG